MALWDLIDLYLISLQSKLAANSITNDVSLQIFNIKRWAGMCGIYFLFFFLLQKQFKYN